MLSSILTIARFESKTLLRSWFFRIFSFIAIAFIFFFNLMGYTNLGGGGWPGRLIPGSVPYMNLFLLNIAQSIIAIFLSSDFLGRDKKLDTTEVFYVRSMSNTAYVLGKTLGILKVFFILNIVILFIGLIFNFIGDDIRMIPITYVLYPLFISLPSVLFVLGLSFFLMVVVRNQAITFVLMLGVLGGSLFYFGPKLYGVFDFFAFNAPLAYSEFIGFNSLSNLIHLRFSYILLGVGFVLLTVYRLPRLPQERYFKLKILSVTTILFMVSALMLFKYTNKQLSQEQVQESMIEAEEALPLVPQIKIFSNQLSVNHHGTEVSIRSEMTIKTKEQRSTINILLNPGFVIKQVTINNKEARFVRKLHVVTIQLDSDAGDEMDLFIEYSGSPDYRAMYTDVDIESKAHVNRLDPLVAGKRIAFVQSSYILLTREALWYPVVGWKEYKSQPQFTQFSINFQSNSDLFVISQGEKSETKDGTILFQPESPLNAVSIVGGQYASRSVDIDSTKISFVYHKNNEGILNYFSEIEDTLSTVIKDIKNGFERDLGIQYPFERFSIIEVPLHFYSYTRNWTLTTEDNMPEMVLVPERGAGSWNYDFKAQKRRIKRRNDRDNDEMMPKEAQVQLFKNTIGNLLINPRGRGFRSSPGVREISGWSKSMVFPQFFSYINGISQSGFPIIQFVTENYLFSQVQGQQRGFDRASLSDQVILKMRGKNLNQILDSMQNDENFADYLAMKGNQFYNTIQMGLKSMELEPVLIDLLKDNSYSVMPNDSFVSELGTIANTDFEQAISDWSQTTQLPAFVFGKTRAYEVKDGDRTRYFVSTLVANKGACDGIITIGIRDQQRGRGGGRGFRGGAPEASVEETYSVPKNKQLQIGLMSDNEPRELIIETYVAENIPTNQRLSIDKISKDPVAFFEGEKEYTGNVQFEESFEIVVDNEDDGFRVSNISETRTLKDWWMGRNIETSATYKKIQIYNPSPQWVSTLGSDFYGRYIKSAVYKQNGSGSAFATWTVNILESGNYAVYVYVNSIRLPRHMRDSDVGEFVYTVRHDDGEDEVLVEPERRRSEWKYLGDFYLSKGEAVVSLSDKTERRLVIADAVKWVKSK